MQIKIMDPFTLLWTHKLTSCNRAMATQKCILNFKNYVYIPPPRPGPHHLLGSNNYKKVQVILSGDLRLGSGEVVLNSFS
jgi:hypothetical protein